MAKGDIRTPASVEQMRSWHQEAIQKKFPWWILVRDYPRKLDSAVCPSEPGEDAGQVGILIDSCYGCMVVAVFDTTRTVEDQLNALIRIKGVKA